MRLDSLTLSSCASRITVSPSANAAATAITGSSSIRRGMIAPPISTPCSLLYLTVRSHIGSASSRKFDSVMSAPMSRRTSRTPVRVGLTPTFLIVSSLPGMIAPATRKNAADEISPGTAISTAWRSSGGSSVMVLPLVSISTPSARNMRSVWSREGAGSITVV